MGIRNPQKHAANLKRFGQGKRARWMAANKVSPAMVNIARGLLMTSPRAQEPSWRAITKMVGILKLNIKPGAHGYRPWRSYHSVTV